MRGHGLSVPKKKLKFINKPLSNFDLINWCDYLDIPITGIYKRDEHMPKKHSPCIINLDELKNIGTHWVCCMPADKHTLWYFDSFGMHYPKEFEIRAKKDKLEVLYNTSQYQDIKSVDIFVSMFYTNGNQEKIFMIF